LSTAVAGEGRHGGRRKALDEAIEVLRPDARLGIADLWETKCHAADLRELGSGSGRQRFA
jgi:hypothetical protein